MMKQLILLFVFMASFTCSAFAQKQVRKDIREGNREYKQEKYTDAEVDYRRALETNARSADAAYNLGNSLYKQGKGQESLEQYKAVVGNETDKSKLSMAWHNIGNIFLASAKDQQGNINNEALKHSIEAYKNALRNNPKDDETRYNLALAQKMLQDNPDNQDQNQQNQQQQQDQQQQNQNQQQDQQQNQPPDQPQQNPNEMSRQNADQILDAMMQEEKNTQEKVKAQQMQQQKQRKKDKNW